MVLESSTTRWSVTGQTVRSGHVRVQVKDSAAHMMSHSDVSDSGHGEDRLLCLLLPRDDISDRPSAEGHDISFS